MRHRDLPKSSGRKGQSSNNNNGNIRSTKPHHSTQRLAAAAQTHPQARRKTSPSAPAQAPVPAATVAVISRQHKWQPDAASGPPRSRGRSGFSRRSSSRNSSGSESCQNQHGKQHSAPISGWHTAASCSQICKRELEHKNEHCHQRRPNNSQQLATRS